MPEVRAPLLILHGDQDEVVPLEQAQRLLAAANEPKHLYVIHGARHNDTYIVGGRDYFDAWLGSCNRWSGKPLSKNKLNGDIPERHKEP